MNKKMSGASRKPAAEAARDSAPKSHLSIVRRDRADDWLASGDWLAAGEKFKPFSRKQLSH